MIPAIIEIFLDIPTVNSYLSLSIAHPTYSQPILYLFNFSNPTHPSTPLYPRSAKKALEILRKKE